MPLAIVLPITSAQKDIFVESCTKELHLVHKGKSIGLIQNPEFFPHRKEERVARQFGTTSTKHPYIKASIEANLAAIFNLCNQPYFQT